MRPVRTDGHVGGGHLMGKQSVDLEHAKELWDEWEIHCLILVSLFLQVFLFLMADMRRRSGSRALLTVLWLAYLLADTVAIFVLGHLAVYVRGPSHELVFFWAPFVLVHLGGQDNITAFSKQDNELWTRHLLSLVSQVAVAGYVVSKSSWPDIRLRAAMVLMFLRGFLKYAGRTYCLYSASPKNLGASSLDSMASTIWSLVDARAETRRSSDEVDIVESWRKKVRESIEERRFKPMFVPDMCWESVSKSDADRGADEIMSVDAPVSDVEMMIVADELPGLLEEFKNGPDRCTAYEFVAAHLIQSYKYLYTKTPLSDDVSTLYYLIYTPFQYLPTAIALALFAAAEKKSHYSQADIIVSYLLLVGAIVLELLPIFTSILSYTRKPFRPETAIGWAQLYLFNCIVRPLGWQTRKHWSEELAQYSMIRRYASVQEGYHYHACMPALRTWAGKGFFGSWGVELFDLTRTPLTGDLKLLVFDKLLLQASKQEWKLASFRGERALEEWMGSHSVTEPGRSLSYAALHMSVSSSRVDFPTSVLIWHIATDICYFSEDEKGGDIDPDETTKKKKMSRELSLYIMYLVFKCDVMLTRISRLGHKSAHETLKNYISPFQQSPQVDEKEAVKVASEAMKELKRLADPQEDSTPRVAHQDKTNVEAANKDAAATSSSRTEELLQSTEEALSFPVLSHAYAVAQELMAIDEEAARWDVISEVWLEMLFYTAPRCGAAFHYEHLSTGGEFITHVLVLMRNLGPFMPKPGA
ncbi:unnamed protein product [Urochloa decumbens]|uniref:DUF4220 domain-containing protein n=1 Tax=Urochloa decumbens TaxID=240449 RepID=A0ABC9AYL2_9POAL